MTVPGGHWIVSLKLHRSAMLTEMVVQMIGEFEIELEQFHNDLNHPNPARRLLLMRTDIQNGAKRL